MVKVKAKNTKPWKCSYYRWHAWSAEEDLHGENFETIEIEWKDLILFEDDTSEEKTIAAVRIDRIPYHENVRTKKLYNLYADTATVMDDVDGDLSMAASEIFGCNNMMTQSIKKRLRRNDLYYVSKVYVDPKFRGTGFGAFIVKNLYRIIRAHARDYEPVIVLHPSAIEFERDTEEHKEMTLRLRNWYLRNGFMPIAENSNTLVWYASVPEEGRINK